MKILSSIRKVHNDLVADYTPLKARIDRDVGAHKTGYWFYTSRIKTIESYAQKLETGRYAPDKVDDFLGCTLVVRNLDEFPDALKVVKKFCKIESRRPKTDSSTHKKPEEFPFDDLRLYVSLRDDPKLPPSGMTNFSFEFQIKTFLQHAWSLATHDLVYKSSTINWATSRIAYQVKAMLEHAEISIQEAIILSKTPQLAKANPYTEEMLKIISSLERLWKKWELPPDIVRLADTINSLSRKLKLSMEEIEKIVNEETRLGRGTKLINLSPYAVIIQSLLDAKTKMMEGAVVQHDRRFKFFIPREVELPSGFNPAHLKYVIRTL